MTITHMGLHRPHVPNSPMVKEKSFFDSQVADTDPKDEDPWWTHWEPIEDCATIGEARRKIAAKYGNTLSHIYHGEA